MTSAWQWLDTPFGLAQLVETLAHQPRFAVDTESNSLYAYREQVCLLQISTAHTDYLIDTLALDPAPLAPLFANPQIQKVFHAVEYDLICLRRDFKWQVHNIFDTMIAARTLGWTQLGLAALLETHFAVKADKKHQRANWGLRPLPSDQLAYARLDTHYLLELQDKLELELHAKDCYAEAHEEFERLTRSINDNHFTHPTFDPENFWSITGARDLTPQQAASLRELYVYRDTIAQQTNRPPFKVMGDEVLLNIVKAAPTNIEELHNVRGVSGAIQRYSASLLAAFQRGTQTAPCYPPRPEKANDQIMGRYETLRKWRKSKAQARGVEADVILPRETLWALARKPPQTLADFAHIHELGPVRREKYGSELLTLLHPPAPQ